MAIKAMNQYTITELYDGKDGVPGTSIFFHIKYSMVANPMTAAEMQETPSDYIGTYVDNVYEDSIDPKKYTWSRFKGQDGNTGPTGLPGINGADGKTSYLHIKYSNDGGITFTSSSGETPGDYIGQYTDFNINDSTSVSAYTWSLIRGATGQQGAQGVPGIQGPAGSNGQTLYTWVKYAENASGGGMSDLPAGKTYIGFAYNKTTSVESSGASDYAWSLIKGEQGIQGATGPNGQTLYTWLKYADSPTSGMNDLPAGKLYMGIAYNKSSITESTNYADYSWSLIKGDTGATGPQGPQGPPGQDGNIGNFPDTLPVAPTVTVDVFGFGSIEINWTFESKIYYTYEVYASKTNNFTPNAMDLIHEGQTSSFLFQAQPGETWYFKVCGKNSYGKRTAFSAQVSATTIKVDNLSNYVSEMAIADALIGTLRLDRGWVGTLKANYFDAKNLSVTDGNGLRTLDIDSYGNVNLNVASLKLIGRNVATEDSVKSVSDKQIELENANKANENEIINIKSNGVSKVSNAIVTIDNNGISVARENSEFSSLQNEKGLYMKSYGKEIARYDKDGLKTNYAVLERAQVGHLRFENGTDCQQIHYIEDLSIGGINVPTMLTYKKIASEEGWEVD